MESTRALGSRLPAEGCGAVRLRCWSGEPELHAACNRADLPLLDGPVVAEGRVELLSVLREQSVSETTHRYGNLTERGRV